MERANDLLKTYLSEKTLRVQYDKKKSETLPLNYDVPQGSILDLILFVNDLLCNVPAVSTMLHANLCDKRF